MAKWTMVETRLFLPLAISHSRGLETHMTSGVTRRQFVSAIAATVAADAVLGAQRPNATSLPIIDSHIHLFDKTRPEGAPWPRDPEPGTVPAPGMTALPARYRTIVKPFGVVGAIVVEASPR